MNDGVLRPEAGPSPRGGSGETKAGIDENHPLLTMRGPFPGYHALPGGLRSALTVYDGLRRNYSPDLAEQIAREKAQGDLLRLMVGLQRLSFRSVCHVATRNSHVDADYVRGKMGTLSTLIGLFWWNDGGGRVRGRLLLLAWKKAAAVADTRKLRSEPKASEPVPSPDFPIPEAI